METVPHGGYPLVEVAPLPPSVVRLETTVLQHPGHLRAKQAIARVHRRARSRGLGVHCELDSRGMLIVGQAREGKTFALRDYARDFPTVRLVDGRPTGPLPAGLAHALRDADYRPIVMASVPSQADLRAFVSAILGAFGYRAREWWDTAAIVARIREYVLEMKTDMIFVDEAHNLLNLRDAGSTALVVEFLKDLLNEIPAQFVIAGLPELKELPKYAPQLNGRLDPPLTISSYRWGHASETKLYLGLLGRFEQAIGLPAPSDLASFDVARRLHVASLGGRIGWTVKLLARATLNAVEAGDDHVGLARLGEAYAEFDYSLEDEDGTVPVDYEDERAFLRTLSAEAEIDDGSNPFLCDPDRLAPLLGELRRRLDVERRQLAVRMGVPRPANDAGEATDESGDPRLGSNAGRETRLRPARPKQAMLGRSR